MPPVKRKKRVKIRFRIYSRSTLSDQGITKYEGMVGTMEIPSLAKGEVLDLLNELGRNDPMDVLQG